MLKLFLESLDKNRLNVFEKLRFFKSLGILGGGTALALQIGHRISFDFDIFTYQKLDGNLWKKAKEVFGVKSEKLLDDKDQLDLMTPENIAVTFFHDDYKHMFTPIETETIDLMDPKDIAVNKAYILGKRPKWRDYVDLYFLLKKRYVSLQSLIELSKKKFASDFSERLFLEQLVYWNDIGNNIVEFTGRDVPPSEIKLYLEKEARGIKKDLF